MDMTIPDHTRSRRRMISMWFLPAAALISMGSSICRADDRKLVVIAPQSFHAALRLFVQHKQRDLPTELIALEKILARTDGVDDPEKLKRFLYAAWRGRGAAYALLVGDADVLPVRYMVLDRKTKAAFDYAFYPSDLYYADLARPDASFDDWNAHKDGFHAAYFGEVRGEANKQDPINFDKIDYRPEIAVGRWPVSTPEQAAVIAAKTIKFENRLARRPTSQVRRAGLIAVGGWVDARGHLDRIAAHLGDTWTIEKRYYADKKRNDHTPPPSKPEIVKLINDGVGLLFHAGHGSSNSWAGCLSVNNLPELDNAGRLPVVLSAGCSTAYFAPLPPYGAYVDVNGDEHQGTDKGEVFDAPPPPPAPYQRRFNRTGLGEKLVRAGPSGAVAYIGCNTGSQPCGLTLLIGFAKTLGQSAEPRLGDCWSGAIRYYFEKERLAQLKPTKSWYPPSIFFQGMKFMVFGDPSLRLPKDR